jgi:hypothetical protein
LKKKGFYTASEAVYAAGLRARYKVVNAKVPADVGA